VQAVRARRAFQGVAFGHLIIRGGGLKREGEKEGRRALDTAYVRSLNKKPSIIMGT